MKSISLIITLSLAALILVVPVLEDSEKHSGPVVNVDKNHLPAHAM